MFKYNLRHLLNNLTPGARRAKLGDLQAEIIEKHNAMLAKLDADAAVTDNDYAATLAIDPLDDQ